MLAFPGVASAATITPSTHLVDDAVVNGNCTLREAILSVNGTTFIDDCAANSTGTLGTSDTIQLTAGLTYTVTVAGDNEEGGALGDLDVAKDLTIIGSAAALPIVQGNVGDDRVFDVPVTNASLTLQDLKVDDGEVDNVASAFGGNIRFQGASGEALTLNNVDVTSGLVDANGAGENGGGIAATGGGQVTIQNGSLIANNVVGVSPGNSYLGGGISISGADTDLTISNSTVSGNDAGVGVATGGIGGGVFVNATGDSTVNLTDATISGNRAGGDPVNATGGFGGGLASNFGSPQITITGGSIDNNTAGGGAGNGTGFGGGVYVFGIDEALNLSGVTVSNNRAGGNGGTGQGQGGGMYTDVDTDIQNSLVDGNDSGFDTGVGGMTPNPIGTGGGIQAALGTVNDLTITGTTVSDNRAGENIGNGGGIQMSSDGNLSVTSSVISGNEAGQEFGGGVGQGGGINRSEPPTGAPTDSILLSVIRDNRAEGGNTTRGGGVQVNTEGNFTIQRSTVSGNFATAGTGTAFGGGLYLSGGNVAAGSHTVENVTVHNNTANNPTLIGGHGGGINVGEVGAVMDTNVAINHSTITNNTAEADTFVPGGGNLRTVDGVGSIDLRASIVSGGASDAGEENCSQNVADGINSQGFNVEGPPSVSPTSQCGLDQPSDGVADPLVGNFLANGGPAVGSTLAVQESLLTRAITTASPAFNRVTTGCPPPTTDEVGTARPQGTACDSGAFELFVAPPVVNPTPLPPPLTTTPTTTTKKKCKKGRKLKKGKCVKKRKKRK